MDQCVCNHNPGLDRWVYSHIAPPRSFVAVAMDIALMAAAERDGKFIADLAAQRAVLGKA